MTNKEIIDNIKQHLTNEPDSNIAYLQTELEIYRQMNNEEVVYAIANMLFQYLPNEVKEKLDLKTHEILNDRRLEYETVVNLINNNELEKAKDILIKQTNIYLQATYTKEQNFYDFDQMIEYYLFCENLKNAKKLHVRRYPEPLTYYQYQLSSIYQKENNLKKAKEALYQGLEFNPCCQYIIQELMYITQKENSLDELETLSLKSLKYAYTKEQLSYAYQMLAKCYENKNAELSKTLLLLSEKKNIQNANLQQMKIANIQIGISNLVTSAISEFLKYTVQIHDLESVDYLLTIAKELYQEDDFLLLNNEIQKLWREQNEQNN